MLTLSFLGGILLVTSLLQAIQHGKDCLKSSRIIQAFNGSFLWFGFIGGSFNSWSSLYCWTCYLPWSIKLLMKSLMKRLHHMNKGQIWMLSIDKLYMHLHSLCQHGFLTQELKCMRSHTGSIVFQQHLFKWLNGKDSSEP